MSSSRRCRTCGTPIAAQPAHHYVCTACWWEPRTSPPAPPPAPITQRQPEQLSFADDGERWTNALSTFLAECDRQDHERKAAA